MKGKLIVAMIIMVAVVGVIYFEIGDQPCEEGVITSEIVAEIEMRESVIEDSVYWYQVPELGVEFQVSKFDLDDLVYEMSNETTVCLNRKSRNIFLADKYSGNDHYFVGCWDGVVFLETKENWENTLSDWGMTAEEWKTQNPFVLYRNNDVIRYVMPQDSVGNFGEYEGMFPEVDQTTAATITRRTLRFIVN